MSDIRAPRFTVAVDFDGCLFTRGWPDVGDPIWETINKAKEVKANGGALILFTCREDMDERKYLTEALEACHSVGLEFDAVNDGLPEHIAIFGHNPRKPFADEYWDDKAVRMPS